MDELPELPFEKVLSYLSLEDRLKSRAVSRGWRNMVDRFRVKTLCFSGRPIGFIFEKSRWVSGAFAQNFIRSTRSSFFKAYGPTILSNLKQLRLCYVSLCTANIQAIQSFGRVEKLDFVGVISQEKEFDLNLPMLTSIRFEHVHKIEKLALEAPKLRQVKLLNCNSLRLDIVHGESVERLLTDDLSHVEMKNLKNLKQLHTGLSTEIDSTLLSGLEQLKEVHTIDLNEVSKLFVQKERYGRADLKIYYLGLLLNGPDDPERSSFEAILRCSAENPSRLADEIPVCICLSCRAIERVSPGSEMNLLKRFADLIEIEANRPVQDTQRFLDFLKNLPNIVHLKFEGDQPQDLFDRLHEHSPFSA